MDAVLAAGQSPDQHNSESVYQCLGVYLILDPLKQWLVKPDTVLPPDT
jgi:hypothetical protein